MTDRWRLFVAVPLGAPLRAALSEAVDRWHGRPDLADLRWTDPESWHVTLHFIGATDPSAVSGIHRTLKEITAGHRPMRLETGGLGGFPSTSRARVAWYGVADAGRQLSALAEDVREALAPGETARFRPHVTLARSRAGEVDLRGWIHEAGPPVATLLVEQLLLMRSHLGRGPARHEIVDSLAIGAALHV